MPLRWRINFLLKNDKNGIIHVTLITFCNRFLTEFFLFLFQL